jgi:hypothetical protein
LVPDYVDVGPFQYARNLLLVPQNAVREAIAAFNEHFPEVFLLAIPARELLRRQEQDILVAPVVPEHVPEDVIGVDGDSALVPDMPEHHGDRAAIIVCHISISPDPELVRRCTLAEHLRNRSKNLIHSYAVSGTMPVLFGNETL